MWGNSCDVATEIAEDGGSRFRSSGPGSITCGIQRSGPKICCTEQVREPDRGQSTTRTCTERDGRMSPGGDIRVMRLSEMPTTSRR